MADALFYSPSESEDEGFGDVLRIMRDYLNLWRNLRVRQVFFITFGVVLLCKIKYGPLLLEILTSTPRQQIVEENSTMFTWIHVVHVLSLLYAMFLEIRIHYPNFMVLRRGRPGQVLQSGSATEEDAETGQSNPTDPENRQSRRAPGSASRATERVKEDVAQPTAQLAVEPEAQHCGIAQPCGRKRSLTPEMAEDSSTSNCQSLIVVIAFVCVIIVQIFFMTKSLRQSNIGMIDIVSSSILGAFVIWQVHILRKFTNKLTVFLRIMWVAALMCIPGISWSEVCHLELNSYAKRFFAISATALTIKLGNFLYNYKNSASRTYFN